MIELPEKLLFYIYKKNPKTKLKNLAASSCHLDIFVVIYNTRKCKNVTLSITMIDPLQNILVMMQTFFCIQNFIKVIFKIQKPEYIILIIVHHARLWAQIALA